MPGPISTRLMAQTGVSMASFAEDKLNTDAFFSRQELLDIGFSSVGRRVQVSRQCNFYGIDGSIGDNVRIDDLCIFKGRVTIGSFVHIASFCLVSGAQGTVTFSDFSGLAARSSVYTASDDYAADMLSNPTLPEEYLATVVGDITLGRGALVGAHCIILPKTEIGEFATVAAMCLVRGKLEPGFVYMSANGRPSRFQARDIAKLNAMADEVMSAWQKQIADQG
jgi:acetyltransferase-like isoleucine patch superfamily enzyme